MLSGSGLGKIHKSFGTVPIQYLAGLLGGGRDMVTKMNLICSVLVRQAFVFENPAALYI